ncbi:hypothetical protein [Sporolactobacillus sp. KGMB 08714]|uniref:hypothetical protein n=1 Tax=Sporolactobacillus sp. KGMB 08714 TaxID=3064704 RepID=UPI002FBE94E3
MIEQDKNWDGTCTCTECYWNMWNPRSRTKDDSSKVCVSESLDDTKMQPNTNKCPGFLSYKEFCGCEKGEK